MSSVLTAALATWPNEVTLDFEAGKAAIDSLTMADIPAHVIDIIEYDPAEVTLKGLQAYLTDALAVVKDIEELRFNNVAIFNKLGHNILVLGDCTYGDYPDGWDELVAITDTKKVAAAIGFSTR